MTFLSVGVRCGAQWNEGKKIRLYRYTPITLLNRVLSEKERLCTKCYYLSSSHGFFLSQFLIKSYCIASIALLKFFGKNILIQLNFLLYIPNALEHRCLCWTLSSKQKVIINVRVFMILYYQYN